MPIQIHSFQKMCFFSQQTSVENCPFSLWKETKLLLVWDQIWDWTRGRPLQMLHGQKTSWGSVNWSSTNLQGKSFAKMQFEILRHHLENHPLVSCCILWLKKKIARVDHFQWNFWGSKHWNLLKSRVHSSWLGLFDLQRLLQEQKALGVSVTFPFSTSWHGHDIDHFSNKSLAPA